MPRAAVEKQRQDRDAAKAEAKAKADAFFKASGKSDEEVKGSVKQMKKALVDEARESVIRPPALVSLSA